MNPPEASPVTPRRSYGKWLALGLVILVTPLLIVGAAAWSMLTLDRDTALLRREVMAATGSDWHTRIQLDIGWGTLGTARTILHFVKHEHADDARLALAAVRSASVGVYERDREEDGVSAGELFGRTDQMMRARGWTRMVGVADGNQHVLVYTSDHERGDRIDLCIAVVDGKELVVVATQMDGEALAKLVAKHTPADFRSQLKFAKLTL